MEDLKFDYIEIGLPNILGRWNKGEERQPIAIDEFLKPFVEAVAKKHPNWRFVCRNYFRKEINEVLHHIAYSFTIFEGREALGEIGTDYGRHNARVYTITNERIRRQRERGTDTKTKDLNKAIKIVGKMVGAKRVDEHLSEIISETNNIVHQAGMDRERRFNHAYEFMVMKLIPHVMTNWETVSAIALQEGADPALIESIPELFNEHQITDKVRKCHTQKTGAVVLIHGNDYAVHNLDANDGDTVSVFGTDTLPAHLKSAIGMLKLVEPKHFIANVGVKIRNNAFYVIKEAEA